MTLLGGSTIGSVEPLKPSGYARTVRGPPGVLQGGRTGALPDVCPFVFEFAVYHALQRFDGEPQLLSLLVESGQLIKQGKVRPPY